MDKINFRFSLLQARFPSLYTEAQEKVSGGVKPADILADWLKELEFRRMSGLDQVNVQANTPETNKLSFEDASSIMEGLD